MATTSKTINLTDYLVLAASMACSLFAGLYYAYKERKQYSTYRYHRGGGKLKVLPVALSLLVTFESSIFFLGAPAEIYFNGGQYWLNSVAILIGHCGFYWIVIPLFYPLQITSMFEYLERRHGSKFLRQMATVLSTVYMLIYSGIVLFAACVAIEPVTNIPKESSIIGMILIAAAYTSLGGIKAVVVTDTIQAIFMVIGIFAVLINGIVQVGGIGNVIALNKATGRLKMVNFDINPLTRHTFWGFVIAGPIRVLGYTLKQPAVQRLNSTKSMNDAKKVAAIGIAGFTVLDLLVVAEGLVTYAYFSNKRCDPLASGQISNPNQIMPYTVVDMFANIPGMSGLYLAAICCATLSTLSSLLGSVSAVISEDFIKSYCKTITDKKLVTASKAIVPFAGLIGIGIALLVTGVKGPVTQINESIMGAVDAPLNCILLMSIFVKFCTKKGLLSGGLVGLVMALWISLGFSFSPGRKQTPWLPLAPTDRCDFLDNSSVVELSDVFARPTNSSSNYSTLQPISDITTSFVVGNAILTAGNGRNNFSNTSTTYNTSFPPTTSRITTEATAAVTPIRGLDYLYSISYQYFAAIVLLLSLVTATVVSKFTQPAKRTPIPPELMLSCSCRSRCCSLGSRYPEEDVKIDVNGVQEDFELRHSLTENMTNQEIKNT